MGSMVMAKVKVLYIELDDADRKLVERLAADSGALVGRPVSMSDVIRQLVRDAAARGRPIRVQKS
jgi:hypothetical protein